MSKKEKLLKGFNNLLQSTEVEENQSENNINNKKHTSNSLNVKTAKRQDVYTNNNLDAETSKHLNAQMAKLLDVSTSEHLNVETSIQINSQIAKYKEFKKCTLYLPSDLMDRLSYMKILTKKDLSVLTAEAIQDYLIKNNVKDNI